MALIDMSLMKGNPLFVAYSGVKHLDKTTLKFNHLRLTVCIHNIVRICLSDMMEAFGKIKLL